MHRAKLASALTEYDRKVSARERIPNIHRLPLLFEAMDAALATHAEGAPLRIALIAYFDPDFPPIKKYLATLP